MPFKRLENRQQELASIIKQIAEAQARLYNLAGSFTASVETAQAMVLANQSLDLSKNTLKEIRPEQL